MSEIYARARYAARLRHEHPGVAENPARFCGTGSSPVGLSSTSGAHYGAHTVAMSALVGSEGRVLAVEPADHALSVLRRNIEINELDNVAVLATALGDAPAKAMLHMHGDRSRAPLNQFADGDSGSESVTVARLDDLVQVGPVDFIKIDIEGYERAQGTPVKDRR